MRKLSDVADVSVGTVVRDGEFATLGFVMHRRRGRLVFIEGAEWAAALAAAEGVAAVITSESIAPLIRPDLALLVAPDPRTAFYDVHEYLVRETSFYGVDQPTSIAATARVHERAFIAPRGVLIGEGALVEPNATVLSGVTLEENAVVRAGAVIGSEGFQVIASPGRTPRRILHGGRVTIARGAEVRAGCCIDRALFGGSTVVGEDSTLDHHVYIAHDVSLGPRALVGAGAVVNGSTSVGADAWIGPNATLAGGIVVGAGARVSLGSVVTRDVADQAQVTGNFAVEHERFLAWLRTIR